MFHSIFVWTMCVTFAIISMAHNCDCCERTQHPTEQKKKESDWKEVRVVIDLNVKVAHTGLMKVSFNFPPQLDGSSKKYFIQVSQLKDNICQQNDKQIYSQTRTFQTDWMDMMRLTNCAKYRTEGFAFNETHMGKFYPKEFQHKSIEDPVINGSFVSASLLHLSWNATQNMCENSAIIAEVSDATNRSSCVTVVVGSKQCILPQSINCSHIRYENAESLLRYGHLMIYPNLSPRPRKYVVSVWKLDYELKQLIKGLVLYSHPVEENIWWTAGTIGVLAAFAVLSVILAVSRIATKGENRYYLPALPKKCKSSASMEVASADTRIQSTDNKNGKFEIVATLRLEVSKHLPRKKQMTDNKETVDAAVYDYCTIEDNGTESCGRNVTNLPLVIRQTSQRTKQVTENKTVGGTADDYCVMTDHRTQSCDEYVGPQVTGLVCKQSGIVLQKPDIRSTKVPNLKGLDKNFR